jgi:predicted TIM-barrel fold metal-dependent hydrolase
MPTYPTGVYYRFGPAGVRLASDGVYSDELLLPWLRSLLEPMPDTELLDAHLHLGRNDPEGWTCSADELVESLARVGGRGVVFPLMESVGYREANDAVLEASAASDGRLIPFCRIDPHTEPVAELERCLAAGARGVKLHPRAERFDLKDPGVAAILAVAAERRLPVTIHSGLGIPSLGMVESRRPFGAVLTGRAFPHLAG